MKKTFEITKQYIKRLFCDKCPDVEMQRNKAPTIALAPGRPPRHTYICPVCRNSHVTHMIYPAMMTDMVELVTSEGESESKVTNLC